MEVSFWTHVFDVDSARTITKKIREILQVFYNRDDYEIIFINSYGEDIDEMKNLEAEYPENVMLVNCTPVDRDNAFEIMLRYASGACFIEVGSKFVLKESVFSTLLYDENVCDKDNLKYIRNKYAYILLGKGDGTFEYKKEYEYKCLTDYRECAGTIDAHYFFQDIYVASKVREEGLTHIYDIGSRIEGYISHLLSMGIKVTMIDIRPMDYGIKGLDFIQGNACELSEIQDSSLDVLSCLHALEHFGLGRYGDSMDYYGWEKALGQYKRVLMPGGKLFLSVPVGKIERVCFNAHRVFRPLTIVKELCPEMKLLEFTYIHNGKLTTVDFSDNTVTENTERILEELSDSNLGDYDCGIYVFKRN